MTDVLSESRPRSRGRVRCDLCCKRIPRGTQYTRTTEDAARYVQKWWDGEESIGLEQAIDWAWEACHGAATSRHELLTALRFRWRFWRGRPRRVTVSRAALRKWFKHERRL